MSGGYSAATALLGRGAALPVTTAKLAAEHSAFSTRAALASVTLALILLIAKAWAAYATDSTAMLGSLADTALDVIASIDDTRRRADRCSSRGQRPSLRARQGRGARRARAGRADFRLGGRHRVARGRSAHAWRADRGDGPRHHRVTVRDRRDVRAAWYQRRVIARTGSVAIKTDNVHYKSDLMLNGAVIAAWCSTRRCTSRAPTRCSGSRIALWLLWGAWRASSEAVNQLMDREWPEEERQLFLAACAAYPQLEGLHDLRTRSSGTMRFAQFHVWVPADWTVQEAHDRLDAVEEELQERFPGTEILIHVDPEGQTDRETLLPSDITERAE